MDMMDSLNWHNCAMPNASVLSYNWTGLLNDSSKSAIENETKIIGLATMTGIAITFIADIVINLECNKKTIIFNCINVKNISRTILLTFLFVMLPLLFLLLTFALFYKALCSVVIKRKDKNFVEYLDSCDVFWSLEDDASKSVINVLGVVESDSPYIIADAIKDKLRSICLSHESKIFYRRKEEYGYYYWTRYSEVDMDRYVEIAEIPNKCNADMNLEHLMTTLQMQSLPYDNEGLFKILITKHRICNSNQERGEYGIIFRIHHSVGDGVALMEFLCHSFADKTDKYPVNMFSFPEGSKSIETRSIIHMMRKLWELPLCFVDGILRKPDVNNLHGPQLLGTKIFKWTESDEKLLLKVKDIKKAVENLKFSDVLLAALSNGLRNFFTQKLARIPEDVAVVLPVRFFKPSKTENSMKLKNEFSVTILDVPVEQNDFTKLKYGCKLLRKSADPLTNYYFLNLVCSVLPKSLLHPILNSSQATMVFSNLPGPDTLTICGGNVLKKLVFFVPHKGLGVTALCYGGVLRFAAMADTALVSTSDDLALILDGMVEEIHRLHEEFVK